MLEGMDIRYLSTTLIQSRFRKWCDAFRAVIRQLFLLFPDRVLPGAPKVAVLRREEAVREGDALVVPCIVTSQPAAQVRYVLNSSISGALHRDVTARRPSTVRV